jgi:hypothetical protein
MATQRGEEPQWWTKCQRESLCKSARYELESSPAGRRKSEKVILRPYVRDEKEVDVCENGK